MHLVLGVIFGGFVLAGVVAAIRGFTMTTDNKSMPILLYLVAVPLIIFGVTGVATLLTVAGRD